MAQDARDELTRHLAPQPGRITRQRAIFAFTFAPQFRHESSGLGGLIQALGCMNPLLGRPNSLRGASCCSG